MLRDSWRSAPFLLVDPGTPNDGKPFMEPAMRATIHLYCVDSELKTAYAVRLIQTIMDGCESSRRKMALT